MEKLFYSSVEGCGKHLRCISAALSSSSFSVFRHSHALFKNRHPINKSCSRNKENFLFAVHIFMLQKDALLPKIFLHRMDIFPFGIQTPRACRPLWGAARKCNSLFCLPIKATQRQRHSFGSAQPVDLLDALPLLQHMCLESSLPNIYAQEGSPMPWQSCGHWPQRCLPFHSFVSLNIQQKS